MATISARHKKRQKRSWLIAALLLLLAALVSGHWLIAVLLSLVFYLANELLWSDHIFYSPQCDYQYQLRGTRIKHQWQGSQLMLSPDVLPGDTLLLQIPVLAGLAGRWFDPYVEIGEGDAAVRQYLERGVGGIRYLNLSGAAQQLAAGQPMRVSGQHCRVDKTASVLWSYDNSALAAASTVLVAPHADDAEIAAFGLYSQANDCTVVTITAGETEVQQFTAWTEDEQQASRFKGEVRALDSAAAALWGGLQPEQCINLGYGCLQLQVMHEQPAVVVTSPYSGLGDTRGYRRFNRGILPSDADGLSSWHNLVADLAFILEVQQPGVLVCPHPQLDTHSDHRYTTLALWQAAQLLQQSPQWLLYANHLDASQDFPFGPANTVHGLPPAVRQPVSVDGLYSVGLSADTCRRKALALDLMHDLKRPLKWKKWWRKRLQRVLLARDLNPYGEDDFFRKAVRQCELFIVADSSQMAVLIDSLET